MAIDELHVVEQWGEAWRATYSKLVMLRSRIDSKIPWFGTSATLEPDVLESVKRLAGFDSDVRIQRTSIDRPDIAFRIRVIQHTVSSFRDLEFLLAPAKDAIEKVTKRRADDAARKSIKSGDIATAKEIIAHNVRRNRGKGGSESRACCNKIPKTIIYMQEISHIEVAESILISWLIKAGISETEVVHTVKAYHSELAEYDKRAISTEFSKPDVDDISQTSRHRIIIATDAMGMGINNPDVRRVVQWRQPDRMGTLFQRAGRAARGQGIYGEFIWLIEPWCVGPKAKSLNIPHKTLAPSQLSQSFQSESAFTSPPPSPRTRTRKTTEEEDRRSRMPAIFWLMINGQSCIRLRVLEHFGEDVTGYQRSSAPCCSVCDGEIITPPSTKCHTIRFTQSAAWITTAVEAALRTWRANKVLPLFSQSQHTDSSIILMDSVIRTMSRAAKELNSIEDLTNLVEDKWAFLAEFGEEVLAVIQQACKDASPTLKKKKSAVNKIVLHGDSLG